MKERIVQAEQRLTQLEAIENPDTDQLGSIEYCRGCIKHLKKRLK